MTDNLSSRAAPEIFISYSSEDRDRIGPIVQLVRALRSNSVFQDFTSIRPGEKWADAIVKALEHCQTVIVFWCEHSAASEWVRQEYEAAINTGKEVIPILLDGTAVPEPLRVYQWLDFRKEEPHGGLLDFVPMVFRRSGRHYYPKDERGEYRDWESEEFHEEQGERRHAWRKSQQRRSEEIANSIAARLADSNAP